jgi:copper chaperone CopZ
VAMGWKGGPKMQLVSRVIGSGGLALTLALALAPAMGWAEPAAAQAAASPAGAPAGEVQVTVLGVTAPFFTFGIVKRLEQIPGVQHASFNLLHGRADVQLKPGAVVTDDELRQAVRSASYSIGGIHWIRRPDAAGSASTAGIAAVNQGTK